MTVSSSPLCPGVYSQCLVHSRHLFNNDFFHAVMGPKGGCGMLYSAVSIHECVTAGSGLHPVLTIILWVFHGVDVPRDHPFPTLSYRAHQRTSG